MRKGILVLAAAIAAASAQTPPAPEAARQRPPTAAAATGAARAAVIDAAAAGYRRVTWRRDLAPGSSTLVGYFDGGELRLIDETAARPGAPSLRNRYYFVNGALFYFSGEQPVTAVGAGSAGIAPRVPVRAEFRGAMTLSAVRIEHYGEVRLDPAATSAIRRRAATLASAAAVAATAPAER
ncbi:MAG TPA: hypothetical protein VN787_00160 [Steroidobacteraceae bacterium]|nr:hypothetical protein [Steroidobacteraceae bacterium]